MLREQDEEHKAIKKIPVLCEKNVLGDLDPGVDRPVDEWGGGAGVREGGLPGHNPGGLANRPGQHSTNHSKFLVNIFPVFFGFILSGSDRVNNRLIFNLPRIFIFFSYFFVYTLNSIYKKIIQKNTTDMV